MFIYLFTYHFSIDGPYHSKNLFVVEKYPLPNFCTEFLELDKSFHGESICHMPAYVLYYSLSQVPKSTDAVKKSWAKSHLSFSIYNPGKKIHFTLKFRLEILIWWSHIMKKKTANQLFSSKFHCSKTLIKNSKPFFYRYLNFQQVIFNLKMCQWKMFFMEKIDQNPLKTSKKFVMLIQNPRSHHMDFVLWLILGRKVINFMVLFAGCGKYVDCS